MALAVHLAVMAAAGAFRLEERMSVVIAALAQAVKPVTGATVREESIDGV